MDEKPLRMNYYLPLRMNYYLPIVVDVELGEGEDGS